MNSRLGIAKILRSIQKRQELAPHEDAACIEAAMLLEQEAEKDAFDARLSELETWQQGFDGEWSDLEVERQQIERRLSDLEMG